MPRAPLIECHALKLDEGEDVSPMQFISADLLEHYRQCERNLLALLAELLGREQAPDTE